MRKTLAFLASAALVGFTLAAHADSVTYNFNAVYSGNTYTSAPPYGPTGPTNGPVTATATGTVQYDNVAKVVTTADIFVNVFGKTTEYFSSSLVPGTNFSYSTASGPYVYTAISLAPTSSSSVQFTFAAASITATGGNLLLAGGPPSQFISGFGPPIQATSGSLSLPTAATPEPSSLVLLGTGILGFAGAARRRFLKA